MVLYIEILKGFSFEKKKHSELLVDVHEKSLFQNMWVIKLSARHWKSMLDWYMQIPPLWTYLRSISNYLLVFWLSIAIQLLSFSTKNT